MTKARVLIVDDEQSQYEILRRYLEPYPVEVQVADGTAEALRRLSGERFQAVLCDLVMAQGGGMEVLRFAHSRAIQTPVIIITGYGDEETAEECLTAGAFDFISKPVDRLSLLAVLRRALLRSGLLFEEIPPPQVPRSTAQFPHLIGTSDAMQGVLARVAKVAEADTNVCVYGESGTGKELVARAIHYSGPRANQPLIVLDCAAIPEGLMESEMFGHVRGSFTSAMTDREGVFQLADGGTLFLDEVGELSLPLQAKLLRVIQCREFRKVGGKHPIKVNVRIVAATNKDLRAMVTEGKFREDLFYRLEVIPITMPPLRQRKEDIPLLVDHFIQKFNRNNKKQIRGISSTTMGVLLRYHWPGNVRELENCIERAAVMADGDILDVKDLTQVLRPGPAPARTDPDPWPRSLKDAERDLILKTLQSVQGNRTRAAELLGISLRGLHYKLKSFRQEGISAISAEE
ncbi:MAG: sigma-54-dependent transcriptional regulator [Candidatus Methylomirabilales bacterium]